MSTLRIGSLQWDWDKVLNRLILFVTIGVLANLAFSFWITDGHISWEQLKFHPAYFLLALLLALVPWLTHGFRLLLWAKLLRHQLSLRQAVQIAVLTDVGSVVTPTIVGGAPIKIGMLKKHGFHSGEAGILIAIASLEDIIFFVLVGISSLLYASPVQQSMWMPVWEGILKKGHLLPYLMVGLGVWTFSYQVWLKKMSFWKKWQKKLRRLWMETRVVLRFIYRKGWKTFLLSAFTNCLQWSCRFMVLLTLIKSIGIEANYLELFFMQWMVYLAMAFVPTPGASGGAEAAFYFVYKSILPESLLGIVVAGWRIITYYYILLLGVVLLQIGRLLQSSLRKKEAVTNRL
ncbi:MAG: lysylphosphatidylglycerol synthase transmembrane domain-containing protein [Bacteroidota bacterium]